jgi:hypothetical protein
MEMLPSELTAHLATSEMELQLLEKRDLAVGVPAKERHRAATCPSMSYL